MKIAFLILLLLGVAACGPKAFTDGQYDDPEKVILLDDKFNENDMQLVANKLVESLEGYESVKSAKQKPVVIVGRVRNRTSEHIDVKSMTDKIRTALIQSGKFRFSDRAAREALKEEYDYQAGEYVDQATATKKGNQVGVNYLITGDIASNVQEVGNDKVVYYKVTMNLIDVNTNLIEWSDEREVRKRFKKRSVGF